MLVKKSESKEMKNSPDCTVWEYKFPSNLFSAASARIGGRYPDRGRVANLECEEIYYVVSGSGIVHSEKGDFELREGDLYFFSKGEKFWVEGKDLFVVIANAPKFKSEQHRQVE
jgi:mannose-6-phosphate isomerase-like protein (cupin superfamily)